MVARSFSFAAVAAVALGVLALGGQGCGSDSNSGPASSSGGHASGGGGPAGGGGAGGAPMCTKASECSAPHRACVEAACVDGACAVVPLAAGTPLGDMTPHDCKKSVCDGQGQVTDVADDSDAPASTDCVTNACVAGSVMATDEAAGTACASGVCDGTGTCVACNTPADCPAPSGECSFAVCQAGVCSTGFKDAGTPLSIQTNGDCKKAVCDGLGGTTEQDDDNDVFDDGNDCTADTCANGMRENTALPGNACGAPGAGLVCDSLGQCSGCTDASQCGQADVCKTPTCTSNTCGFDFQPAGPIAAQTHGDCATAVCDGHGTLQSVADPNDVPGDDGNACTGESCSGGMAVHPPLSQGTSCAGGKCDGAGSCVACNFPSDCPAPPTICQVATCVNNACGVASANNDGTVCKPASCTNGVAAAADLCANGACVDGGTTTCSPYVCGAPGCATTCATDMSCDMAGGFSCDTGIGRCTNGPKCTDYCNEMATNCSGADLMYFSQAACLATCAAFPPDAAMSGNTLGCRLYHGGAPAMADPVTHCPHAGPAGEGVCGAECESFCTLAAGLCTGANKQWPDMASCMTDCATFPTTAPYNAGVTGGDSYACRLYHLTAASVTPNVHCPHIQKNSAVCQ